MNLKALSASNRSILLLLKRKGPMRMEDLAVQLKVSKEAVRQQATGLHREGWVRKEKAPRREIRAGRPSFRYGLTAAGEAFFPKNYDSLAAEVLETLVQKMGPAALRGLLSDMTESRVKKWAPLLDGKSLKEKLEHLKNLYLEGDPFASVTRTQDGFRLIEGNCPFLNVAAEHPSLCSVTVSTLSQLLGVKVVREERFQSGHGRCVFHVYKYGLVGGKPGNRTFKMEDEMPGK